jgi:hypothetical protein
MDFVFIDRAKAWPCDNSDMQSLWRKTNQLNADTEAQEKAECGIS